MATQWYYTRGGEQTRIGPVSSEELRKAATAGELRPADLVWHEGMTQWASASNVKGLFATPGAAPTAVQETPTTTVEPTTPQPEASTPAEISYYRGQLPPRAAATLAGHAPPRGDVGDWPLGDQRVALFEHTVKLRRRISAAAQLYRTLFALSLIAAVIIGIVGLFAVQGSRATRGAGALEMIVAFIVIGAFVALYAVMARATSRSLRWGPLTMFIVFICALAFNFFTMVMAVGSGSSAAAVTGVVSGLFGAILPAIFAVMSWRAFSAIPKYLHQPAWCQELCIKSKI